MTKAKFYLCGDKLEADISGHAGFSTNGPDIVCAACSTLTYTLLQSCLSAGCEVKHTEPSNGSFFISVSCNDDTAQKARTIFETIAQGFALLAVRYPYNVSYQIYAGDNPEDAGDRPKTDTPDRRQKGNL